VLLYTVVKILLLRVLPLVIADVTKRRNSATSTIYGSVFYIVIFEKCPMRFSAGRSCCDSL